MSNFTVRAYQEAAVAATLAALEQGVKAPLVVIGTGGGKTWVIASTIVKILTQFPKAKMLLLSHIQELIDQDAKALVELGIDVGVYCAGLGRKEQKQITAATIASVHRAADFADQDVILIDEAHLVSYAAGMYQQFIAKVRQANPGMRLIGYTATPTRMKTGSIVGKNRLFDRVVYEKNEAQLTAAGYLKPLYYQAYEEGQVDLTTVRKIAGEYAIDDLARMYDVEQTVQYHARLAAMLAKKRATWLAFCVNISHACAFASALNALGIPSRAIHSKLSDGERHEALAQFKSGQIRCLSSVATLTTGFDTRYLGLKRVEIDCIISLRPTMSAVLWQQIKGRGTRAVYATGNLDTEEGRCRAIAASTHPNCLVVSFCGNPQRFEFMDGVKQPGQPGQKRNSHFSKTCPVCHGVVPMAVRVCNGWDEEHGRACTHMFYEAAPQMRVKTNLASAAQLEVTPEGTWMVVTGVLYSKHEKLGKPATLRVDYALERQTVSEWICIEHSGYPQHKARAWWQQRMAGRSMPGTVDEALRYVGRFSRPHKILVKRENGYMHVKNYRF